MKPPAMKARPAVQRLLRSVRFRLTIWFVAILAVILAGFSALVYLRQIDALKADAASRLEMRAGQYDDYFHNLLRRDTEREEEEERLPDLPAGSFVALQSYDLLALLSPDGELQQATANFDLADLQGVLAAWQQSPSPGSALAYPLSAQGRTQAYLFHLSQIGYERQASLLVLGTPLDPAGQLPRLLVTLGLSSAVILAAAFLGGYWLASRAMHPVQVITRTAREIGEGDLNRRLNLKGDDELAQLAGTFDQMLARLQRAFERQRQFTADASHELRTPLSIIQLEASRILEHRRPAEEYEKTLRIIQSENEWMSRLVNQLLTLARMDSEQAVMQREPIDLSDVIVDTVERLTPLAQQRGVELTIGALPEAIIHSDRAYLTQMLTNLVENAIKYCDNAHGQVALQVGSEQRTGAPGAWLSVTDNGPGIPEAHLEHLFDRFYRADKARTHSEEAETGSGLGLAIVQSIVQAHGGTIEVHSRPGEGARFTVWLPVHPPERNVG